MRFIFAFSSEPLQLRFLNWILGRTDIDKNVLMEAVRNKDAQFVDGISEFTKFQSEVKKWANKIGNSSNIFLDCIYDRCANDDDSFKYMFGDDSDKSRYTKRYEHILNELYDAFVNSDEFSKEGRFMQRAKDVFNGFKNKRTTLEKLVKDMNQILVDNNRNSQNEEEDDGRTFEQREEDSWKVLEANEEYSRGEWHVYRVDEYEDMKNVASKCSEWCVARADSGRSYFYGTYGPPYYLFCKGKRNPWILMHIPSEQFKGLDDDKFEPDRPTSYEAIEIGRSFLDEIGELRSYYDEGEDFSVFNEDNAFSGEPELDDRNVIDGASDEELKRMLDNTDSPTTISKIVDGSNDYGIIMEALDKYSGPYGDLVKTIIRKNLPNSIGTEKALKVYERIINECEETGNQGLRKHVIGVVLVYVDNPEIVLPIIEKYCDRREVVDIVYSILGSTCSDTIIEWMIENGMADAAKDIMLKVNDNELFKTVIEKHANDASLMMWVIDSRRLNEEIIKPIAEKTTNREVLMKLAEECETNRRWNGDVASIMWKKVNDREIVEKLFKSTTRKSKEVADAMLSKATNKEERHKAIMSGASHDEIIKCFDEDIDEMEWKGVHAGEYYLFTLFREEIDDRERLVKLFEKVGYDLDIVKSTMLSGHPMKPEVDDIIKAVSNIPSMSKLQAIIALQEITTIGNGVMPKIEASEKNRRLMTELLKRYNDDKSLSNQIVESSKDTDFVRSVIMEHDVSSHFIYKWIEYRKDEQTPEMIRRLAEAVKDGNDRRMIPTVISFQNCPKDVIEMFRNETANGAGYGDDDMYSITEFRRGMLDDGDAFFENYCRKNANYEARIWELLKLCRRNGQFLSHCIDLLLGYDFVSESVKRKVAEFLLQDDKNGEIDGGSQTLGKMIDWCIGHNSASVEILCSESATDEQIRKIVEREVDSPHWTGIVDKAVISMSSLARRIVSEYEENGDLNVSWEDLVFNPESTEEDLSKALDSIEDDSHPEEQVEALLKHRNCTKELAARALDCIDYDEYVDEGYDIEAILKWTGAGILTMKDGHGYDARTCIRTYENLSLVAQKARSEQELDEVIEYSGMIDDETEDDYDTDVENGKFKDLLSSVYCNKVCSLDYFENMCNRFNGVVSADGDLQSYIDTHTGTLSSEDIDRICEKHEKLLMNEERIVGSLEKCQNATEEQLLMFINKYNAVGNITQIAFALGNDNTTENVVLEMMELVRSDDAMNEIVSSDKATEAVYRKAVEMRMGKKSLKTVMENTSDKELSDRVRSMLEDESTKYGLASQINEENGIEKLKNLVIRMYRLSVHMSYDAYASGNMIRNIENPRALELMSKTKNKDILSAVVQNPNTPEKTVLPILKKFQSKNILTAATYRMEKSILLYVGCVTRNPSDIDRIFKWKERMRMFTPEDVMRMLKWNPACKFDILKHTYFKLGDEQLRSLKKLQDKDVDWIVDAILRKDEPDENDAKAGRIVNRMLKASRIIRNLLTD